MANRTIALHIGPHKTGSTAIQTFCHECRAPLGANGVHYASGFWHGQLGSCFVDDPLKFVFNVHGNRTDRDTIVVEDAAYLASLSREIETARQETIVLSYEGFFSLGASAIKRLHGFLRGISDRQTVIFYCRPPESFAVSELSQRLRMGLPSGFDDGHDLPILAYKQKIPPFVDVFGRENVLARHFARAELTNEDVVEDFFAAIDHPQINRHLAPSRRASENESISAEAALLAIEIAKRSEPPMPGNRFLVRYDRILSGIRGAKIALTRRQGEQILSASRPHSEYLEREFGIRFDVDTPLGEPQAIEPQGIEPQVIEARQQLFQADFIESMAEQLQGIVAQMERDQSEQIAQQQQLAAQARSLEEQLAAVYASNSWRATAPLRMLRQTISGVVGTLAPRIRGVLSRANRLPTGK